MRETIRIRRKTMKNKTFTRYWIISVLSVFIASFYPLYMGIRVVTDMIRDGEVMAENYPKYVIPYTPISLAIIIGVLILPLAFKLCKRFALPAASLFSLAVFFTSELLLESQVMVATVKYVGLKTDLESWQMYICAFVPEYWDTEKEISMLIGDYSPAFKLHFYFISIVLILAFLGCFYGFGKMILGKDKSKLKNLIMQSVLTLMFLGMCIWACFTAFYRTGELNISSLSAALMSVFFVLFGMTVGIYLNTLLQGKNICLSLVMPSVLASAVTLIMYIAEMILLSGHVYRFGFGFLFRGIPFIVLAPFDIFIILLSGALTFLTVTLLRRFTVKQSTD